MLLGNFTFAMFALLLYCISSFVISIKAASNGRFPFAYHGTKGWMTLDVASDRSNDSSLTLDFLSMTSNATEIDWYIMNTPFVYGDEPCDEQVQRVNGSLTSGTLKVTNRLDSGGWRGSIILNGISPSKLQARSILLTETTPKGKRALACLNILSDDVVVFESQFYGPLISGFVYFFFDTTTKIMKLYNRLVDGNNLDPAVNWTLKNKWWIPDVDSHEPSWASCRESGDNADVRYAPPSNFSLQPESSQLLEINGDSGQSMSSDELESSVLVLTRQQRETWQKDSVLGCSRIRRSDGWSAEAIEKNNTNIDRLVSLKQDTLFHPLRVQFKRPKNGASPSMTNLKSAVTGIQRDANGGNVSTIVFASSNFTAGSIRSNINRQHQPPVFSLHQRSRQSSGNGQCARTSGQSLSLLSLENSLLAESDEADDANIFYSAYFTDAALESVGNNVLLKTIRVRWPDMENEYWCATIKPSQQRTAFGQSAFYYPFAGIVAFMQPKGRPESITVVAGDLEHLFDTKPSVNVNWTITMRPVDPDLDDMSCSRDRDVYDPSTMRTELCVKSKLTCSIGEMTTQFGPLTISGNGASGENASSASFTFFSRMLPLGGSYSIVGQALKVDASWAKGCSNISHVPSLSLMDDDSCMLHAAVNEHSQTHYRGAVATFEGIGGISGSLFMYQPNRVQHDSISPASTTVCNNLQLTNGTKIANLIFELVGTSAGQEEKACQNTSATVFNPFLIDTAKKDYSQACTNSDCHCAIGDLTHRVASTPPGHCMCVNFLPVSGIFGVIGRILRIRRRDTRQIVTCRLFRPWEVASSEMYVQPGISRQQLADGVAGEFHIDSERVDVSPMKDGPTASKFKGCVLYGISIFDPNSRTIASNLSQYAMDMNSGWSEKWGSNQCTSGASAVSPVSIVTGLFGIVISIYLLFW